MRMLSVYLKPAGDRISINYDAVLDFTDGDVWRAQNEGDTRRREEIYDDCLRDNVERATTELYLAQKGN